MTKDDDVISLDERRRALPRQRPRGERPERGGPAKPLGTAGAGGAHSSADASPAPGDTSPVPGRLIWLYCPTCRTLEYTEMDIAGGRVHNVCGAQVLEAAVELDLRTEATVAQVNLERLGILESLLAAQRQRYEEYLHRVHLAAGRPLAPYPSAEEGTSEPPASEVDAFGLLVSRFFKDPSAHFPELATDAPPDASED